MKIDHADIYDALYKWKDYAGEADQINDLIQIHNHGARKLLDLGCGTAEHHRYLQRYLSVDGLDRDTGYLRKAQSKNPHGRYFAEDMISFELQSKYDIIISLFSAIGYVKTIDNLKKVAEQIHWHLNPKGIVLIEPWIDPQKWTDGMVHMQQFEDDQVKICRMNVSRSENDISILDFHYLVGEKNHVTTHFTERHELGLFTLEQYFEAFAENGIALHLLPDDSIKRGLLLGKRLVDI